MTINKDKIIDGKRVGTFTKLADDVGMISYNGNIDITALEMKLFCDIMYTAMNHKRFYLINKVKEIGVFTPEVWEFLGTDITHNNTIIASAVTSNSLGYKLQTNFFFKDFPLKYPVKLFKNKDLALEWIEELKRSNK